ncbi:MAG: PEGA domain-containing protein [Deltaproteobacteria bacterium]|nr:MAG: PEGA domain-containing protein [Deltaproteobacteria bacterium]TMQ22193.1 MAG: PEGA domain-containing protein [Deltaproteobacteria bacterium]
MTRVLSSACVVLLVLGAGGRAWAGGKPPIAILGLEVWDNGGGIDPETTRAAKELTTALRDRAKAGTGPYTPVQGGEKELIDEKLLNNCDTEANTCMAAIGNELGAEVLMYGRIWVDKPVQTGQGTYKVSLKLLNVGRKQLANSMVETLPITESTGSKASAHARAWYSKLVEAVTGGTLAIKANIDRGTVIVDEDARGTLASGRLSVSGLSEGRHTLAIEAKDYQRYETSVTVRTGETTVHGVTMVEMSKRPPPGPPETISREGTVTSRGKTNYWKPTFYATTALGVAAGTFTYLSYRSQKDAAKGLTGNESNSGCDGATSGAFENSCKYYKRQVIGWVGVGVFGAAAITSFYMAYFRGGGSEADTKSATGGHRKHRELVVAPVVTPNGGGATLKFDW